MPYPKKQATAIFLDLKRRKGDKAAHAFGRKYMTKKRRNEVFKPKNRVRARTHSRDTHTGVRG